MMADKYYTKHHRKKCGKRGQVALMISFFLACLIMLMIAAVFAPMGVDLSSKLYVEGEAIMLEANSTIQGINDTGIRTEITNSMNNALGATQDNIEVNAAIFQYGWILIIVIGGLVVFLYTRRMVEFGYGGFI